MEDERCLAKEYNTVLTRNHRAMQEAEMKLLRMKKYKKSMQRYKKKLVLIMVVTPAGVPPVVPGSTGIGHKTGVILPV
ncbi:unnamed protein product [Linum tenue]|uniref:Uncharacterized protein n=1 Tax=Linum tenue TaxID=586396 RepID=A0AAV0KYL3_9ROSI|nr:unnamed protein product [Linum tenue]